MVFTFVDLSNDFVDACRQLFGCSARYYTGNIELYQPKGRKVYYVSPANSMGFMDGGIDAAYSIRMFPGLEQNVKNAIKKSSTYKTLLGRHYLPIGKALVVPITQHDNYFLVCAPTMLLPQNVQETKNAYYAMIATLQAVRQHGYDHQRDELIIPGLCCGYGGLSGQEAAQQIYNAISNPDTSLDIDKILTEQPNYYENLEYKNIHPSKILTK